MQDKDPKQWIGTLSVEPKESIVAGGYGEWRLMYTTGRYGIDNGGRLRLLFRYAWDGGRLQTINPAADDYVTISSSRPGVCLSARWDSRGGRRPWLGALIIEVRDEPLAEGDVVTIHIGDKSGGSRGHRAQSFVESDFRWLMDIEAFETGTWIEVPDCPVCPIIPAEPKRLVVLAPSQAVVGQPIQLLVKCEDAFGNPAVGYRGEVTLRAEDCNSSEPVTFEGRHSRSFEAGDRGLGQFDDIRLRDPTTIRFHVEDGMGWTATSNLVEVCSNSPALSHFWGDMHAQYNNALGTGSVHEAMRYARDAAAISFAGHQPNDFQLHRSGWDEARTEIPGFYEPGRFVPFLGYEWSGNTPAGGDRNVHFLGDDGPLHRSSHWHVPEKDDEGTDRYPLSELYQEFAGRGDVLMVPHVGGRRCEISSYYNPELEPVIEIASCHGRFEWLLREALENGYTVGVIGGSDDHTGRPGAAYPTGHSFGTRGGLAGVYAKGLTRESIFAALRARHCYATTGERIALSVETSDGYMMGDAYSAEEPPTLRIRVAGTAPLESVEIMRNMDVAYSLPLSIVCDPHRIRLQWSGARVKGRGRQTVWTGGAQIKGARITAVKAVAFDNPHQGITSWDEHQVHWTSTTAGDFDAVELTLDGSEKTMISVDTPPAKFRFSLSRILKKALIKDCGGVNQQFLARLCTLQPGPLMASFEWKDPHPSLGSNAYWLRVTQEDGEMAWSSPIYVNRQ
jgi:hypothetical protein